VNVFNPIRKAQHPPSPLMAPRTLPVLCLLFIFLALPQSFGQEGVDRDDSRNALAQVEGLGFGKVDPRSGSLQFSIPIGHAYPQRGGGSFGLSLQYSSHINRYTNNPSTREEHGPGGPTTPPLTDHRLVRFQWKAGLAHVGLGTVLNTGFGALYLNVGGSAQDNLKKATFVLPDGREIYFYDRFQEGQTRAANTWFSRGGEYARLKYDSAADQFLVELSGGTTHLFDKFGNTYRATEIRDRYNPNNKLTLAYGTTMVAGETITRWTITDSESRQFFIDFGTTFQPYGDAEAEDNPDIHPIFLQAPVYEVVTAVTAPEFGGTTATYTFTPEIFSNFQPYNDPVNLAPIFFSEYHAALLKTLSLPTGETYEFAYYQDPADPHPGALESLTNPNGGIAKWTFTAVHDPDNVGSFGKSDPHMSVTRQQILDRDGTTLLRQTDYLYKLIDENGIYDGDGDRGSQRTDRVTVVRNYITDTAFNDTLYFFNMRNYSSDVDKERHEVAMSGSGIHVRITGESRFLQMPGTLHLIREFYREDFSQTYTGEDAFLATRAFEGSYQSGTPLVSTYVRYQADPALEEAGDVRNGHDQLVNARTYLQITHYHDADTTAFTYKTDWTGFGAFRTQITNIDFVEDQRQMLSHEFRTVTNHFLPGPETTNHPGSLTWLLNLPKYREITHSGSTDKVRQDFDYDRAKGFLRRTRQYVAFDGNLTDSDRLTVYIPDADGRVSEVRYYGGELKKVPTDSSIDLGDIDLSGINPERRTGMTYQFGSEKQNRVLYPGTGNIYLTLSARTIDANTGLTVSETSPDGVTTTFDYDALGRTISVTPASGATTITAYQPMTDTAPTKVITTQQSGGTLGESQQFLDGWGRVVQQRTKMPGSNAWAVQLRNYDQQPDGYLNRETTTYLNGSGDATWIDYTYDALGRKSSITLPDNTTTNYDFFGAQEVVQSLEFDVNLCAPERLITQQYDALGRLVSVTQADETLGADATTDYDYDINGNLTFVSQSTETPNPVTQTRTWNYDALGQLLVETHPEIDGTVFYGSFDSAGNVLEKQTLGTNTTRTLEFFYQDPMRRLTRIHDAETNRPIQANYYARTNRGTSKSAGKIYQIQRHNYSPAGEKLNAGDGEADREMVVTRTYFYDEANGRVSAMRTRSSVGLHTPAMSFEQTYTYTPTGQIEDLQYPEMPNAVAINQPLTLTYDYFPANAGLLLRVTNANGANPVTGMTYHANGIPASWTFANGVQKLVDLADDNMPRPSKIRTTGITNPGNGNPQNLDTGLFSYDCAGNITAIGNDTYSYDAVNRLTSASIEDLGGQNRAFTYTYDRFGNMIGMNANSIGVHTASNRLNQTGYAYDDYGNVTDTPVAQYQYDNLNMTGEASFDGITYHYIYETDAQGQQLRLMTVRGNGNATWTLRGMNGKLLRTFEKKGQGHVRAKYDHIYARGLVGRLEYTQAGATKRHYLVTDHLGSVRMRTDGSGDLIRAYKYDAFGSDLPGSSDDDDDVLRFTEHEKDADHQTYMLARYYNPQVARFNSIDNILGTPENPQSWNRYTYVNNNPIRFIDPDGNQEQSPNNSGTLLDSLKKRVSGLTGSAAAGFAGHVATLSGEGDILNATATFLEKTGAKVLTNGKFQFVASTKNLQQFKILANAKNISRFKIIGGKVVRFAGVAGLLIEGGIIANDAINTYKAHLDSEISKILNDSEGRQLAENLEALRTSIELRFQEAEKSCNCQIPRNLEELSKIPPPE